jgi:selenocysteine-specific elongation factor
VRELNDELGMSLEDATQLLERLTRFGRLHRVAANRYFLPETVARLRAIAMELSAGNDGFTAGEFNRRSVIGRNLTIQVLEHLDRIGATVRTGEVRHMADQA